MKYEWKTKETVDNFCDAINDYFRDNENKPYFDVIHMMKSSFTYYDEAGVKCQAVFETDSSRKSHTLTTSCIEWNHWT